MLLVGHELLLGSIMTKTNISLFTANLQAYQRALYGPLANILTDDVNNIQLNAENVFQEVPG